MLDTLTVIGTRLDLVIFMWVTIGTVGLGILVIVATLVFGWDGPEFIGGVLLVVGTVTGIGWAIAAIPYDAKYWHAYSTTGTIENVTNGYIEGNGDQTWRSFVVTLEGDPNLYVTDNPRFTQLEGSNVDLTCTVEFNYLAADKINCDLAAVNHTEK